MVSVLYIEGSCVSSVTLDKWSTLACLNHMGVTVEELEQSAAAREDGDYDDATECSVREELDRVVVTVYCYDGEATFFIGPKEGFVADL